MNKESNDYKLLKRIKAFDKEAFDEFYKKNEPLVYSILKRYSHKTSDYEDLLMSARYGLVKAIYFFDIEQDVEFSTYAFPLILGEIRSYFKGLHLLKIPRKYADISKKIEEANKTIQEKYNRSATIEEICLLTNESKEDVIESLGSLMKVDYLDEEISEDTRKIDLISENGLSLVDKLDLKLALEELDKKERLIIEMRYFDGLTQSEVSKRLNLSQVQISRIEAKTLLKLKELLV
ncbi:MAG: sigma-70 family RNA polymerase sigma factor [Erysipelotrichaceae bacterium]|nr:sigma-70 family RNA polymerase sigma factor [Erysipelotrichaceae bacterium]